MEAGKPRLNMFLKQLIKLQKFENHENQYNHSFISPYPKGWTLWLFAIFSFINNCVKNIFVHRAFCKFYRISSGHFSRCDITLSKMWTLKTLDKHATHLHAQSAQVSGESQWPITYLYSWFILPFVFQLSFQQCSIFITENIELGHNKVGKEWTGSQ